MIDEARIRIQVSGRPTWVPSAYVGDRRVVVTGNSLRIAAVMDEALVEGETVRDPDAFVSQLRRTRLKPDIFTFAQHLPDITPKHGFRLEWDTAAVIPITGYSHWLEKRAAYDVRKAIKRAAREGVVVRRTEFNDGLVEEICQIYNESAVRQGKAFWHYGKQFDDVKRESATYLERSTFIGAYYKEELIGFIKMVRVGTVERTLHVISQKRHFDKKPTNALLAKAVELCELNGASHLVYGEYYPNTSLTEFKRRNGFEQVLVPRYHIPLTLKGKIALRWNLHHGLSATVPERVRVMLRQGRRWWYERLPRHAAEVARSVRDEFPS